MGGPQVPRKRRLLLLVIAALAGAAVVVMPALAGTEGTPAVEAFNGSGAYGEQTHQWRPPSVAIAPGGAITISNPTAVPHGVEWVGGPEAPACGGTIPVGQGRGRVRHRLERYLHVHQARHLHLLLHGPRPLDDGQRDRGDAGNHTDRRPPPTQPPGTGTTPSGPTTTGTSTTRRRRRGRC